MSGLSILSAPASGRRADLIWIRTISERREVLVALVTLVLTTGCATEEATRIGQTSEYVKSFEEARFCAGSLYVSYKAVTDTQSERELLRYLRVPLDAVKWSDWPAERPWVATQSLPPIAVPTFGSGPIPVDPIRCAKRYAIDLDIHMNETALRNEPGRLDQFGSALIGPLATQDFVVVAAQSWIAVSRRAEGGAEWALVDRPGDPRIYRSWWSYPAVALAIMPAIAVDIVISPLVILAVAAHLIH